MDFLVSAALFSIRRFQVPLRYLLAVGLGYAIARPSTIGCALLPGGRPSPRGILVLAIFGALAIALARDVPLLGDMLLRGGASHRFERMARQVSPIAVFCPHVSGRGAIGATRSCTSTALRSS